MIPAIIPARGGSKGVPRKNLVELCGKPLLVWTIEQALASDLITHAIVTTDDDEIGRVAMEHGATVFWRSAATATDDATSESALREVVEGTYEDSQAVVFMQATSPIRQPGELDAAIQMVLSGEADSVFSARQVEGYCWRWSGQIVSPIWSQRVPRQQRSVWTLEENGSFYVFRPSVLLQGGSRLGGMIQPYMMHPLDSYQIDEPADIQLLEQLMEIRLGHQRAAAHG